MKKVDGNTFSYTFKNVQKDIPFHFYSGPVKSKDHKVAVLLKPNMAGFDMFLDYPGYTGRKDETLSNIGDVVIPQGTKVTWNFQADNTDAVSLKFSNLGIKEEANRRSDSRYRYVRKIMRDDIYKIFISNEAIPNPDSITYTLNVTPDQHPEICLLYTSPSPRDATLSRMPSSA